MIDLFALFNQIEAMRYQLEAMSQIVGSEIARQQEQAGQAEPPTRKTFSRRSDIPGAPPSPAEGNKQ